MKTFAWISTAIGLITFSCAGTETQNPANPSLLSFKDSGCKKEKSGLSSVDSATAAEALVSTDYSAETNGLKCIAWEVLDGNRVKIDLVNFESACGPKFVGEATVDGTGKLRLSLSNPGCLVADCGACIYDWSFEVAGLEPKKPLPIQVGIDVCPGEEEIKTSDAVLPVDTQATGIVCKYAAFGALGWQAIVLQQCGTIGMPCSGTPMCQAAQGATEPSCADSLVCTDNGNTSERICAKQCASDADCGSLGVQKCNAGLCRPKSTW